jgi:hypothetical protein
MAKYRKIGFSVFVQRGKSQLCLRRGFQTRESAISYAEEMAKLRPAGAEGLHVKCEVSGDQWRLGELLAREPATVVVVVDAD